MGKKRIIKQTQEDLLKETEKSESKKPKTGKEIKVSQRTEEGIIYINSSYNNTLISATDKKGNVLTWASSGTLGFKGPKKATPFASMRIIDALVPRLQKIGLSRLSIKVKGIGKGRDAAIKALANYNFNITSIKDITPIPHNGCRPPKPRRV